MQLRKIPLLDLIEILTELYDDGADYVDISGQMGEDRDNPQDVIKLTVRPDYVSKSQEGDIEIDMKLSENDINDLI